MEWGTAAEKLEYNNLERAALDFYAPFRERHSSELGTYFLNLTQKLLPVRIACAGGHTPLEGSSDSTDADGNPEEGQGENESDESAPGRKRKTKQVKFSDFAFTSKFNMLIQELRKARDQDPTCKLCRS